MVARSSLLLALAMASTAGCHTWRPTVPADAGGSGSTAIAQAVAAASGPEVRPVRVTTHRGERVVLVGARVEQDSVVGAESGTGARRAVAVAEVRQVETWRVSARRTLGAVAAGVLVAAAAVYAAISAFVAGNV